MGLRNKFEQRAAQLEHGNNGDASDCSKSEPPMGSPQADEARSGDAESSNARGDE
jgi:hypothetical protein